MKTFSGLRRALLPALVLAATAAAMCVTAASASAANTLSLSLEPGIPGKGKPFQSLATGEADKPATTDNRALYVILRPGLGACASTGNLEEAAAYSDSSGLSAVDYETFLPLDEPYNVHNLYKGRPVGHYHLCGYLVDQGPNQIPAATDRLEFTIGGTCASATAKQAAFAKGLKKAKRKKAKAAKKLRKLKHRGAKRKQIKKAQRGKRKAAKQMRKAKRKLKKASAEQDALCI